MKYVTIYSNGQNKMYTISNPDVESKINDFIKDSWSSVHYLWVRTNGGENLKLQYDSNRTLKSLPKYLEGDVSGEIVEVGEEFISQVYSNKILHYL